MKLVYKIVSISMLALLAVSLGGCFGKSDGTTSDTTSFTITIDTSGLTSGASVKISWPSYSMPSGVTSDTTGATIKDNGSYNLKGTLTSTSWDAREGKNVNWYMTVSKQPTGETCTFNPEVGNFDANFTATTKLVCSPNYTVSATVSGLAAGEQVVLNNNSTDPLTVTGDGQATTSATFSKQIAANGSYNVTVTQSPTGKTCTASAATGTGVTANVNVNVTCTTQSFTVGGNITGLPASSQLTLINNGDTAQAYTATGTGSSPLTFTMGQAVAYGGSYNVTVQNQPSGETCTVSNGTGTNVQANVTNVAVSCAPTTYTIGGSIQGLASGQQVTLDNNGADPLIVNANGNFTFATPVAVGSSYNVTIGTQATQQNCIVYSGSGSNVSANVSSVLVNCSAAAFVSDSGSPNVYSFSVQADGTLTPSGIGYTSLDGPGAGVALSADKHYLYVAIPGSSLIDAFVVGSDDSLTPMAIPSVASFSGVSALATSPDGKYLFAGGGSSVETYTISNGVLTPAGSYSAQLTAVQGLTVSNDNTRVFIIGQGLGTYAAIDEAVIDPSGSLLPLFTTTLSGVSANTAEPAYLVEDTARNYLFFSAQNVYGYVNLSGGDPNGNMSIYNAASDTFTGLAFNPSQSNLYAGMFTTGAVWQMTWDGAGNLAAMTPTNVSTGGNTGVSDLAMTKDGAYLFTTDTGSNVLSEYVVGSGGALTLNSVSSSVMPPVDPLATVPPQPYGIAVK